MKKYLEGIFIVDCIIVMNKILLEMKELLKSLYREGVVEIENYFEIGVVIYKVF